MSSVLVKVTQALIDNDRYVPGTRCSMCPVALALKPLFRKDLEIKVVGPRFYIMKDGVQLEAIPLPVFVFAKIKAIDDRKSVDAFDFEIPIPEKYLC